jgi:hypothetical protein
VRNDVANPFIFLLIRINRNAEAQKIIAKKYECLNISNISPKIDTFVALKKIKDQRKKGSLNWFWIPVDHQGVDCYSIETPQLHLIICGADHLR